MMENNMRKNNRNIVEQYMNTYGQARLSRHELFDEEGCGGLWTTDTGEPVVIKSKKQLAKHALWSLDCLNRHG